MATSRKILLENFRGVQKIYDNTMYDNIRIHDLIYPHVFGREQYIGQFSDNSAEEIKLMGNMMRLPQRSSVLDIGCGRGRVAAFMENNFHWKVIGIDLATAPLSQARLLAKKNHHLNFVQGDLYHHPFKNSLDGIYGTGAFCHFDMRKLFARCRQLLRPGGRIAFMERVRLGAINNLDWQHLTKDWCCPYVYTTQEYISLLQEAGFNLIYILDLTFQFRIWQERSVIVREQFKKNILDLSSIDYYRASLNFAKYENDVTRKGGLGYTCIVAEKS